jgi:uncharacterized protein YdeI (BOF family)
MKINQHISITNHLSLSIMRFNMKTSFTISIVALLMIICSFSVFSQTSGDFQSNTTTGGTWSALGSWQTYDGSAWVAATGAPTGSENITIKSGDSVYVDGLVTISGTLKNQGKMGGTDNFTFANGSVYNHAEINGSIPQAIWETGSTCMVTGYVSGSKPNMVILPYCIQGLQIEFISRVPRRISLAR